MSAFSNNPLFSSELPKIGLGCMGMSEFYGQSDDAQSLRVLHTALDLGYRHFDTADMYGRGHNEELLGRFLAALGTRRSEVLVATKVGIRRDVPGGIGVDSTPEYIRTACEASLKRLGVERIGLYYLHRRNPAVPIEETMGAMATLLAEGKVAAVGLSEVSTETLRAATRTVPVSAVQSEYSLWTREPEATLLDACSELGVAFVAYSPLGRGFLSGQLKPSDVAQAGDLRALLPRFRPGAFEANAELLSVVATVAEEVGASQAQVALAWVLAQRPFVHTIPGTRSETRLRENWDSQRLALSTDQCARLAAAFADNAVAGARYPEPLLKTLNT
jgi:aryl-alcohol dehydrogenase-like predicted oxidoreductase